MDVFGLSALDRLFCFMIVRDIQYFLKYLQRVMLRTGAQFYKTLQMFVTTVGNPETLIGTYNTM